MILVEYLPYLYLVPVEGDLVGMLSFFGVKKLEALATRPMRHCFHNELMTDSTKLTEHRVVTDRQSDGQT